MYFPPRFTFFQDFVVNFVGRLAIVENSSRHRNVQALRAQAKAIGKLRLWCRHASIMFCGLVLVNGVVTISRPDVNFLPEVLNHLLDRMIAFRRKFFLRAIRGSSRGYSGSAVNTALRNAWIQLSNKTRIIETIFHETDITELINLMTSEQFLALGFGCDGEFVVAVILICSSMREVLMVRFVFVNVIEIPRKISVVDRRLLPVERSASNALKYFERLSQGVREMLRFAYGVARQKRAANAFNLIAVSPRRCCSKYSLRVVVQNIWTSAHHHLVGIRWTALPTIRVASKAIAFLRRWFGIDWDWLWTRRHWFIV